MEKAIVHFIYLKVEIRLFLVTVYIPLLLNYKKSNISSQSWTEKDYECIWQTFQYADDLRPKKKHSRNDRKFFCFSSISNDEIPCLTKNSQTKMLCCYFGFVAKVHKCFLFMSIKIFAPMKPSWKYQRLHWSNPLAKCELITQLYIQHT